MLCYECVFALLLRAWFFNIGIRICTFVSAYFTEIDATHEHSRSLYTQIKEEEEVEVKKKRILLLPFFHVFSFEHQSKNTYSKLCYACVMVDKKVSTRARAPRPIARTIVKDLQLCCLWPLAAS